MNKRFGVRILNIFGDFSRNFVGNIFSSMVQTPLLRRPPIPWDVGLVIIEGSQNEEKTIVPWVIYIVKYLYLNLVNFYHVKHLNKYKSLFSPF